MHILKTSFRFAMCVFVNHEMGTICLREMNMGNDA